MAGTKGFTHEDCSQVLALAAPGTDEVGVKFGDNDPVTLSTAEIDAAIAVLRRARNYAGKAPKGEAQMVVMKRRKPRETKAAK